MRKVSVHNLRPGMILGKSILSADGSVLLGAGVKFTAHYIERLRELGISSVYIWDERTADLDFAAPIRDITLLKAAGTLRAVMTELQGDLKRTAIVAESLPQLMSIVDDILNDLLSSGKLLLDFIEIKTRDDYTFFHSVNVCVLALLLGRRLGLPEAKLRELGLGALLHDIGKTFIPQEILMKPGRLTEAEWEIMQQHTSRGFEILRSTSEVPLLAAHVAYQHHERYDGRGYPRGLSGERIHQYARITAICDVFDALTSDRVYRPRYAAHETLEYILGAGGTHFDFQLVKKFITCVAPYPLGTRVRLNNGVTGVVIQVPSQVPHRPVVRVLQDEKGRDLDTPYDLPLLEHPQLAITLVLEG